MPQAPAQADTHRRPTHASAEPHSESEVHSALGTSANVQATCGLPRSGGIHVHSPRWLSARHWAPAPHLVSTHAFTHTRFWHRSSEAQSASELHWPPGKEILCLIAKSHKQTLEKTVH